jgi:hypothetical protein
MFIIMKSEAELDMVMHACNSSYYGGRDRRIMVQGQSEEKLVRSHLKKQAEGWVQ